MKEKATTCALITASKLNQNGFLQDTIVKLIHHENVKVRIATQDFIENHSLLNL
jgi:hypothetical protein